MAPKPAGRVWTRRALLATSGLAALAPLAPALAAAPERLTFEGLYKSFGVLGYSFADRVTGLAGREVAMTGYMAPPLKAESDFFVLTREPLAICPFCQSDADWPVDIVVIYMARTAPLLNAGEKLTVTGRLDLGSWTDPASGFVSQIRIRDASFRRA